MMSRLFLFTCLVAWISIPVYAQPSVAIISQVDSLNNSYAKVEQTDLDRAEQTALQALKLASDNHYVKGEADAQSNLGRVQIRRGNHKRALEFLFAAQKLYEMQPDFQNNERYGANLICIAGAFYFEEDFDRSLIYSQKTIELAQRNDFQILLGLAYRTKGEVFRDRGKLDSSLFYFNKASESFTRINHLQHMANINVDIGVNYYYLKDYKQAIAYTKRFYDLAKKLKLKTDYAPGLHNIGEFNFLLRSYDEALQYLDSAQYYGETFGQSEVLLDTYRVKAKVYAALSKADSVAAYYEKVLALKDSVYNETYKKELASLQTQLDVSRHEAENKILVKEKSIATLYRNLAIAALIAIVSLLALVLLRQKLRVQNAVKQKLEKEVAERTSEIVEQKNVIENVNLRLQLSLNRAKVDPHFVFNVLNSIQHLVLEKKPAEASDHLARLSRLARYILEKSSLDEVTLGEEVTMLEQYIRLEQLRLDDKFQYKIDVNIPRDTPLPAMLIQPYVENAIMHGLASAEGPGLLLHLSFEEEEGRIRIMIEDNGVGRKMRPERAGHNSIGSSLGKQRLQILSQLQHGNFEMKTDDLQPDIHGTGGTRVILEVPLKLKQSA